MNDPDKTKKRLIAEVIPTIKKNALDLIDPTKKITFQQVEKEKDIVKLKVINEVNVTALIIANNKLIYQNEESVKRSEDLINAFRELKNTDRKLTIQKEDKKKRTKELLLEKKEFDSQNKKKDIQSAELIIANKELVFQNNEKEKIEKKLARSKQLLDETGRLVKLGSWEIDLKNNELSWSDIIYQIHEVEPDYHPTVESALNFFDSKSLPVISKAVDQAIKEGKPFNLDLQLITVKQNKIWVRVIGNACRFNGIIVKIGGMFQDITELKQADESLLKMKKAINTSGESIFLTNNEGIFTYANPAFTYLYGFSSDEILGKTTPRIIKSGVLENSVYDFFWKTLLNGDEVRGELINKKKDGTLINIEGSATPIFDDKKNIIGFLGIQRDITERKRAEEALNISQQELRIFAMHLQHIQEEEKLALAREIHDDLGQILVALKIELGMFKQKIAKVKNNVNSEEILSKFDELSCLVDKTIKTTRRIMTGLRPEIIDLLGFIEAIKSHILEFEERHHIHCQFESIILELNISPQQSIALYRILQEALTNIAKHAKATSVKIQLSHQTNKFVMEIIDNGIGLNENQKVRQDSYGIIGMKERVLLLNGELFITSKSGKGTSIRVEMPYN